MTTPTIDKLICGTAKVMCSGGGGEGGGDHSKGGGGGVSGSRGYGGVKSGVANRFETESYFKGTE